MLSHASSLTFKSAIVLGADGFLGRSLVRILEDRGCTITCVGKLGGDLAEPGVASRLLSDAPKADRIFHLVTRQRTGQVQYAIQGELLAVNARVHLNVLDAWRQHQPQAKLISTGSSCVYPEQGTPIAEEAFQSGPMHESVRGYGLAKQVLAVGCETYAAQYGLSYLHCILATVYGPHDHKDADRSHFMTGMIHRAASEKAAGHREFTVWGNPDTVRDLLYVDDQIEAIFDADKVFNNERLNVSANTPVTIGDCAHAVVDALGWSAHIVYPPRTFSGTPYKTIDASRFLDRTRWVPKVALREGVERVLSVDYSAMLKSNER